MEPTLALSRITHNKIEQTSISGRWPQASLLIQTEVTRWAAATCWSTPPRGRNTGDLRIYSHANMGDLVWIEQWLTCLEQHVFWNHNNTCMRHVLQGWNLATSIPKRNKLAQLRCLQNTIPEGFGSNPWQLLEDYVCASKWVNKWFPLVLPRSGNWSSFGVQKSNSSVQTMGSKSSVDPNSIGPTVRGKISDSVRVIKPHMVWLTSTDGNTQVRTQRLEVWNICLQWWPGDNVGIYIYYILQYWIWYNYEKNITTQTATTPRPTSTPHLRPPRDLDHRRRMFAFGGLLRSVFRRWSQNGKDDSWAYDGRLSPMKGWFQPPLISWVWEPLSHSDWKPIWPSSKQLG